MYRFRSNLLSTLIGALIALPACACAAADPAPVEDSAAGELNRRLPSWLRFSGELRERFEGFGGGGFQANSSDAYDLHRLRLGLQVKPSRWFRIFAQVQDARAWGRERAAPPYQNTWDLRQGYVEIGDAEGLGFSLRAGRQELNFGNGRLIGASDWSNTSRSFDGLRGALQRGKYRLDAFATSVVIARDGVLDHHNPGNNLHGLYGSLQDVIPGATLEPYTLWHVQQGAAAEQGRPGHLNQHTHGVRLLGKLPLSFDYRTEIALQRGTLGADRIHAWTLHSAIGYSFAGSPDAPRVFVEYNYASGDRAPGDGVTNTFDPIYPSSHDKLGLADQFGWRNIRHARIGGEFHVRRKWTIGTAFSNFWLAEARDALYPARGPIVARRSDGASGKHIGEELDAQAVYSASTHTKFGFGYAHIFTGKFLNRTTQGKDYNFPYVVAEYVF